MKANTQGNLTERSGEAVQRPSRPPSFTQGPWLYNLNGHETAFNVNSVEGVTVCTMSWHTHIRHPYPLRDESEANARLIAAAPDLLRELQRVYDALAGECFDWQPVRDALAKAQV